MMDIGRAIREIAGLKGIKQVDICERTGISDAHMSQIWNSKKYDIYASALYKISLALGVEANDIFELAFKYPHPKDSKDLKQNTSSTTRTGQKGRADGR